MTKRPYNRLPLHVRIFTEHAWGLWNACDSVDLAVSSTAEPTTTGECGKQKKKRGDKKENPGKAIQRYGPFRPLPSTIDVTFDRGGVDGKAHPTAEGRPKAIDVADTTFRNGHWAKWEQCQKAGLSCGICGEALDAQASSTTVVGADKKLIHDGTLESYHVRALSI